MMYVYSWEKRRKNWYANSCCQIILQNWPIDSNIPLPHVGYALWGKKRSKSFQTACFITNNFVTMTVLIHLLCHPQGIVRAEIFSILSAVEARQRTERITSSTAPLQKYQ